MKDKNTIINELEQMSTERLVEFHESHLRMQKSTDNPLKKKNHAEIRNEIFCILSERDKEHLIL